MTNLFIVSTAHHLLSVKSAFIQMNCVKDTNILIVATYKDSPAKIKEILRTLDLNWNEIYFAELWNFHDDGLFYCLKRIKDYTVICSEIKSQHSIDNIFVIQYTTDYSHYLIGAFPSGAVYLLDEGNASYIWAGNRKIGRANFPLLKKLLFNFKLNDRDSVTFISQYDLQISSRDKLIRTSLDQLFSVEDCQYSGTIYFLGGDYAHKKIINLSYYLEICRSVKKDFSNFTIKYVPHRFESESDIKTVEDLGFEILRTDVPIEFYFNKEKIIPSGIISLYSAAIQNLHSIYKNKSKIYAVLIDKNRIGWNADTIEAIQDYYQTLCSDTFSTINY